MKNTPKNQETISNPNYISKRMLTVADFQVWQQANAAANAEAEERVIESMVDALLRHVAVRMNWGLQAACLDAWRCIGRHMPHAHKDLAAETLEAIGWVRKQRGQAE